VVLPGAPAGGSVTAAQLDRPAHPCVATES
jgi:hypothetical protein